jgi:1-acyl-sn-glycerol-3-phosphate acyltransferase
VGRFVSRLNYYYRILGTGFCFTAFGFGGVLLSLLVFPLQRVLIPEVGRRKKVARHTVHLSFRFFIAMMRMLGIFSYDLEVRALLARSQGKIIIANHPSLIDVVALISMIPNADCVVKAQLFRNPFVRGVITSTGYLNNSDPDRMLDDCAESLRQGNNLIIFPEGTRTTPGTAFSFQRGAANIAIRSKADYLALWISVQPTTLTKDERWFDIPRTKPDMSIRFLQEIKTAELTAHESTSLAARHLTKKLQQFYQGVADQNGKSEV